MCLTHSLSVCVHHRCEDSTRICGLFKLQSEHVACGNRPILEPFDSRKQRLVVAHAPRPRPEALATEPVDSTLATILDQFERVSLEAMAESALGNRIDSKFLFKQSRLNEVLLALSADFQVLEVATQCLQHYSSLYFDTALFDFYHDHHNGRRSRYKVRLRDYVDSDKRFFEIKRKGSDERTDKQRLELDRYPARAILSLLGEVLPEHYQQLQPSLRSHYQRISLVHKTRNERLTLDLGLQLMLPDDPLNTSGISLTNIVIAERKADAQARSSSFDALRRQYEFKETSFSKYCVGCALQYPFLKHNVFKPTLTTLNTLMKEVSL